ncbi:MAG: Hint domain-containing protein [Planktomarina sp.]
MFVDELPPVDGELWVVDRKVPDSVSEPQAKTPRSGGIICFTGTAMITTPNGLKSAADLRPNDTVITKHNGPQPIRWIGHRRISGARLHVMPQMRPIRIKAGSLGAETPLQDLLVAPYQRVVVRDQVALDLFNTKEVLVAAKDLINGRSIYPEPRTQEVMYHHILLDRHEVLYTNGVMTESCHPSQLDMLELEDKQRQELFKLFPNLEWNEDSYGDEALRSLSTSEAALLRHAN